MQAPPARRCSQPTHFATCEIAVCLTELRRSVQGHTQAHEILMCMNRNRGSLCTRTRSHTQSHTLTLDLVDNDTAKQNKHKLKRTHERIQSAIMSLLAPLAMYSTHCPTPQAIACQSPTSARHTEIKANEREQGKTEEKQMQCMHS
jgi:hypothetical protein